MKNLMDERMKKVKCLQENLLSIRKIAGWSAEKLGYNIGVTKQTISNLENGKTPMSFTQYLAIRSVLDEEFENNKENTVLPQVIDILIDKNTEFDKEEQEEINKLVKTIAATSTGGVTGVQLAEVFSKLIKPSLAAVAGVIVAMNAKNGNN